MGKIAILLSVLAVLFTVSTTPVPAGASSSDITVTVDGDGDWSDGVLTVSLFPGQQKVFTVTVNSAAGEDIQISPAAKPDCVVGSRLTACFVPTDATLVAGGSSVFDLIITAEGNVPPGVFSSNLTITADTEPVGPGPSPGSGVPHHVVLVSAQSEVTAGNPHELTATVYDEADNALPDIAVGWSIISGLATAGALDVVTDANGQAHATINCVEVDMSTVRCRVVSGTSISGTVELIWTEDGGNGGTTTPNIRPIVAVVFGEMLTDGSVDRTVTVYNDGDGPLVVSGVARSAGSEDFSYVGPLAPFTVNAGGSTDITLRFTPASVGDLSATFAVASSDPDTSSLSFAVSGTGKSRGKPAWLVFLVGILIIGGCFGGYFYYKRWKGKKSRLDVLAGGSDDLDLAVAGGGGVDDELHLPD